MTERKKRHRFIVIFSLVWSVLSLFFQIAALFFSELLMQTTLEWFYPEASIVYPFLIAFRAELLLLIVINITLLLLWKKEIEGKRFLWFIGLNYATVLLFGLACLTLIANIITKLHVVQYL